MNRTHNTPPSPEQLQAQLYSPYWLKVKVLTWKVLGFWVVSILAAVLMAPMIKLQVFGIPLAYWLISGALLLGFLGAVAYYAWQMDLTDAQHQHLLDTRAADNNSKGSLTRGDTPHENQQARGGQPPG